MSLVYIKIIFLLFVFCLGLVGVFLKRDIVGSFQSLFISMFAGLLLLLTFSKLLGIANGILFTFLAICFLFIVLSVFIFLVYESFPFMKTINKQEIEIDIQR